MDGVGTKAVEAEVCGCDAKKADPDAVQAIGQVAGFTELGYRSPVASGCSAHTLVRHGAGRDLAKSVIDPKCSARPVKHQLDATQDVSSDHSVNRMIEQGPPDDF